MKLSTLPLRPYSGDRGCHGTPRVRSRRVDGHQALDLQDCGETPPEIIASEDLSERTETVLIVAGELADDSGAASTDDLVDEIARRTGSGALRPSLACWVATQHHSTTARVVVATGQQSIQAPGPLRIAALTSSHG